VVPLDWQYDLPQGREVKSPRLRALLLIQGGEFSEVTCFPKSWNEENLHLAIRDDIFNMLKHNRKCLHLRKLYQPNGRFLSCATGLNNCRPYATVTAS
jgi:hypothetical protein